MSNRKSFTYSELSWYSLVSSMIFSCACWKLRPEYLLPAAAMFAIEQLVKFILWTVACLVSRIVGGLVICYFVATEYDPTA